MLIFAWFICLVLYTRKSHSYPFIGPLTLSMTKLTFIKVDLDFNLMDKVKIKPCHGLIMAKLTFGKLTMLNHLWT